MKGDLLPDEDHVVRYIGGSHIKGDMVDPEGFEDERPSVNWLEYHGGDKVQQLACVRDLLRLEPGGTAKLAELGVGAIHSLGENVRVVEAPLPATAKHRADPSHAEIEGIPGERKQRQLVCEALADYVITLHPVKR